MSELTYVELHGDRIAYRDVGRGPALLLIHGMAGSSATWQAIIPQLSKKTASSRRTYWATASPRNRVATTRWAPSRFGCAICSMSLGYTGRR